MNIYRMNPIDQNHPSWRNSSEQECVWVGAPTRGDARKLVADKTAIANVTGTNSPWRNEAVTSCIWTQA